MLDDLSKKSKNEIVRWNIPDFNIFDGGGNNSRLEKYVGSNKDVIVPDGVKEIYEGCFWGKDFIESISFPDSVNELPGFLFSGLINLKNVHFSSNINTIPNSLFLGSGIQEIELPNTIIKVEEAAFSGCKYLKKLTIGDECELDKFAFGVPNSVGFEESSKAVIFYSKNYKYKNNLPNGIKAKQTSNNFNSDGGCYVATCVYGSYDCPQVWALRRFRDNTLAENVFGRLFIKLYYSISPTVVRLFGDYLWFHKLFKTPLDSFVDKLIEKGVETTPYEDR